MRKELLPRRKKVRIAPPDPANVPVDEDLDEELDLASLVDLCYGQPYDVYAARPLSVPFEAFVEYDEDNKVPSDHSWTLSRHDQKMLEKEIPWELIPIHQRGDYYQALVKEWFNFFKV